MTVWKGQFSERRDLVSNGVKLRYLVCSTPRSGSSFLCRLLHSTGRFGYPLEYFNPEHMPKWSERHRESGNSSLLDFLYGIRTSPNGCFGAKVHFAQLPVLSALIPETELASAFRFVRLRRKDRLAQSVSLSIAMQTYVWMAGMPARGEANYSFAHIRDSMRRVAAGEVGWDRFFRRHRGACLELAYEEVLADPAREVRRVGAHLGIELPTALRLDPGRARKQGDERNQAWCDRFLREARAGTGKTNP